jgi:hypothetical protein
VGGGGGEEGLRPTPPMLCARAGKLIYCYVTPDGLSALGIADKEYPVRVIVSLLREIHAQMKADHRCDSEGGGGV